MVDVKLGGAASSGPRSFQSGNHVALKTEEKLVNAFWNIGLVTLLAVLVWPLARAVVLIGAAAACLLSRDRTRRSEARRLLRMMLSRQSNDPQP
jgi:hypothetical protein